MAPTDVIVEPDETAARIRDYLRANQDLRSDPYDGPPETVYGLCYPASEAYFHAEGGTESTLDIYCLSWSDIDPDYSGTHWYLRCTDREAWVDLGIEEPSDGDDIPFDQGTRRAFITGYEPSNRTAGILDALEIDY